MHRSQQLPIEVDCVSSLQTFMLQTNCDGFAFVAWSEQAPNFIANSVATADAADVFQSLEKMLKLSKAKPAEEVSKLLKSNNLPDMADLVERIGQMQSQMFPSLWTVTQGVAKGMFLTCQPFFTSVAPNDVVRFLPTPGSPGVTTAWWAQCSQRQLPHQHMEALQNLAAIVGQNDDYKTLLSRFAMQDFIHKVACFTFDMTEFAQAENHATEALCVELRKVVAPLQTMMEKRQQMEASGTLDDALKDIIRRYLAAHPLQSFFRACEQVFLAAARAESCIPASWMTLIENRQVAQIKSVLFARSTHDKVCGFLNPLVTFNEGLKLAVKASGALLGGTTLSQVKQHEKCVKVLREYGTTMHAMNLLLHRTQNKSARERSAQLRELLGCAGDF